MKNFQYTFNEQLWKWNLNSTLPSVEQSFPENPQRQLQFKCSEPQLQVSPFLQGLSWHRSINDSKFYCGFTLLFASNSVSDRHENRNDQTEQNLKRKKELTSDWTREMKEQMKIIKCISD